MHKFKTTAYQNLSDFIYGKSLHPIPPKKRHDNRRRTVYPEVNFTLPSMMITKETMPEVIASYREIITEMP